MSRLILPAFLIFIMFGTIAVGNVKKQSLQKIITVTVNEQGSVFIGKDTLTLEQLTDELQKRLWKSYMGTDKMYDAIHLEFKGEVRENIIASVKKAILEAQQKALTDICLQKYKKLFEDLSSNQQEKIRKQFPVLFQKDY